MKAHKVTAIECKYSIDGEQLTAITQTPRGTRVRFRTVQFVTKGLGAGEKKSGRVAVLDALLRP